MMLTPLQPLQRLGRVCIAQLRRIERVPDLGFDFRRKGFDLTRRGKTFSLDAGSLGNVNRE
jgi:hypothetical protein